MQEIYRKADAAVKENDDTSGENFQVAALVLDVFVGRAIAYHEQSSA